MEGKHGFVKKSSDNKVKKEIKVNQKNASNYVKEQVVLESAPVHEGHHEEQVAVESHHEEQVAVESHHVEQTVEEQVVLESAPVHEGHHEEQVAVESHHVEQTVEEQVVFESAPTPYSQELIR